MQKRSQIYCKIIGDMLLLTCPTLSCGALDIIVKMSKVAQLEQELGQKPVLVFGNSTGDVPMAVYSEEDNEYLTKVFFLLCDDTQREHGNESKAQKIADICAEKGWVTISMANDWTTIYGENVTINPQ